MTRPPTACLMAVLGVAGALFALQGCDVQDEAPPQASGSDSLYVNSIGIRFRRVPAGTFQMGSTDGDDDERPVHTVEITEPFYVSVHEVTQLEWNALMDRNPSRFKGPQRPVDSVSWYQARSFINRLNANEDTDLYRLPTEAEWEYAVRANSSTTFHFGDTTDTLPAHAWYSVNADRRTHRVAQKQGNAYGLFDMYGNVWEWTQDVYEPSFYEQRRRTDPVNDGGRRLDPRVIRGGGWFSLASNMRSANRAWARPTTQTAKLGFRIVREVPPDEQ